MKILVITTGGTIGSTAVDFVVNVSSYAKLDVLEKYKSESKKYTADTDFDVLPLMNILSENISQKDYKKLIDIVKTYDYSQYDGVIMTHGSDTLSYTAGLMSLVWDKDIPLMIVASQRPVDDIESNAVINFECAVELVRAKAKGVLLPYRNSDNITYIHYADRLMESEMFSDDFCSFSKPYGIYQNDTIQTVDCEHIAEKINIQKIKFNLVLMVTPYPMLDYSRIDLDNVDAVLHKTYHAGTACSDGDSKCSILSFIDRCKKADIPFYICGINRDKNTYQSLEQIKDKGAVLLEDITAPYAYMKLLLDKG